MLPVRSVLVDFDGTACTHDVAEHLMDRFGDPEWRDWDERWMRREVDTRASIRAQVAPFAGKSDELIDYAVSHCPLDPTFPSFVEWCRANDAQITIVSDGLGLYIEPILTAAGRHRRRDRHERLGRRSDGVPQRAPDLRSGAARARCSRCSAPRGPVAFIGEGHSDRYGALYADIVFAKDELVAICRDDGVPYQPYQDFDDVRRALDAATDLPGAVDPERCPGWHVP